MRAVLAARRNPSHEDSRHVIRDDDAARRGAAFGLEPGGLPRPRDGSSGRIEEDRPEAAPRRQGVAEQREKVGGPDLGAASVHDRREVARGLKALGRAAQVRQVALELRLGSRAEAVDPSPHRSGIDGAEPQGEGRDEGEAGGGPRRDREAAPGPVAQRRIGTGMPFSLRAREGLGIARVRVADHARPGVRREDALETRGGRIRAVRDDDHARVHRIADPDSAAMVDRDPRRAGGRVQHRVQERPVRDRVAAVAHRLRLAVRRGDRPAVEVVATDHDRRLHAPAPHELVERETRLRALAVAEPADPRRQPLERDALAGERDPAARARRSPGRGRGSRGRSPRCPPGLPRARPSGTVPCPRRRAAGCRAERIPRSSNASATPASTAPARRLLP